MMTPSYIAKLARAKEHLIDLQAAINSYADTHPYTVSQRIEGNKKPRKVHRLTFNAFPADTPIPIIAADVIYNLRSSLDHLMSALVAPKDRGSAMFPIFFEGVWEAIIPGENSQRVKERARWASDIKTLPDDAVAVLKGLQPADTTPEDPQTNLLRLVNRLSNRDRHEKLPIIGVGLKHPQVDITMPDGKVLGATRTNSPDIALQDNAEIHNIPDNAVKVEIEGVPLIAIQGKLEGRYIEIPLWLVRAAAYIDAQIIPALAPFV
jgi:hypothetical protein